MSNYPVEGTATISLGENSLAEENEHAVVRPGADTKWRIEAYKAPGGGPQPFIIFMDSGGSGELCLTLDTEAGDNENNVMVKTLGLREHPETEGRPSARMCQLWLFKDVTGPGLRVPLVMYARMESVARPWLSATPGVDGFVAGVSNSPGSQTQRWMFQFGPPN